MGGLGRDGESEMGSFRKMLRIDNSFCGNVKETDKVQLFPLFRNVTINTTSRGDFMALRK